jgi:hypothetical protein
MRSFALLAAALTAVLAAPSGWGSDYCLCEAEAHAVADNVEHLFKNYSTPFARRILTKDVRDQTDSVQFLMNNGTLSCPKPVGSSVLWCRLDLTSADFDIARQHHPNRSREPDSYPRDRGQHPVGEPERLLGLQARKHSELRYRMFMS